MDSRLDIPSPPRTQRMLACRLRFWHSRRKIERWANSKRIFFITGSGRSGTAWLASLLANAPAAYVEHEPVTEDFPAYQCAYWDQEAARSYVLKFRMKEIYARCSHHAYISVYGEVNSALRRHVLALCEAFPAAATIHLVRNGRDVVRSMYARKTMTAADPNTRYIAPRSDDPFREKWTSMTRFEKLCWYWQVENAFLRSVIPNTIQFECIQQDYAYLQSHVLNPLGLHIDAETWQHHAGTKINRTMTPGLPHWEKWPSELAENFNQICCAEMSALGYN